MGPIRADFRHQRYRLTFTRTMVDIYRFRTSGNQRPDVSDSDDWFSIPYTNWSLLGEVVVPETHLPYRRRCFQRLKPLGYSFIFITSSLACIRITLLQKPPSFTDTEILIIRKDIISNHSFSGNKIQLSP